MDYKNTRNLEDISELSSRFDNENKIVEELMINIIDNSEEYNYLNNMYITESRKLK